MNLEEHTLKIEIIDQQDGGFALRYQRSKYGKYGTRTFSDFHDLLRFVRVLTDPAATKPWPKEEPKK